MEFQAATGVVVEHAEHIRAEHGPIGARDSILLPNRPQRMAPQVATLERLGQPGSQRQIVAQQAFEPRRVFGRERLIEKGFEFAIGRCGVPLCQASGRGQVRSGALVLRAIVRVG